MVWLLIMNRVFCGGTFGFVVGKDRTNFTISRALIARCSEPLAAMLSSGMQEDITGAVVLDDEDAYTFGSFAEWLHTGIYTSNMPKTVTQDRSRMAQLGVEAKAPRLETIKEFEDLPHAALGFGSTTKKKDRMEEKKKSAWNGQKDSEAQKSDTMGHFPVVDRFSLPSDPTFLYTKNFLGHVNVYIFANKYRIISLERLASTNMRSSLHQLHWPRERASERHRYTCGTYIR